MSHDGPYPETPAGWSTVARRQVGPFTNADRGPGACRPRRALEWWIAAVNLLGCVAFGIAAIASYFVPSHGSVIDLAAANGWTAFGGLCFLVGSVLLLPESAPATDAGDPTDVTTAVAA